MAVEVHSTTDMIVGMAGLQPVRLYPEISGEINVYLFDTVAYKGDDGKSCYEYAIEGGYKGTESEFEACMNKWLNEVCQADPLFTPHKAYYGFSIDDTISDANIGTLTLDPVNTLAAREWPVTNTQAPTPLYAHIVVPSTVADYINTVGIKGGLPGIWSQIPVTIGGLPYMDIRSPYKFADASFILVTTSKSSSVGAMTWITQNGQTILAHIANNSIHLTPQDRAKLDTLSQTYEPKRGSDDFYVTNAEKNQGALATGNTALPTVKKVADKTDFLNKTKYNNSIFEKIKAQRKEPYMFFVKSSQTAFQICSHDAVKHSTYVFSKDANDDFVKLSSIFTGDVGLSVAIPNQAAPANRTGTFIGTVGNLYTTTVGDSFTLNVIGEKLVFYSYGDNRGGVWEFVIDGNYNNKVWLSTYNVTAGLYSQIIAKCLKNGQHTVYAKFTGADPLNPPSGGVARGWIYYTDQVNVNGTINTQTYNNNNNSNQLTYGDSNKEIAMQLTVGAENNFFPDHGVGTAFDRAAKVMSFDGIENNFANIPVSAHIGFSEFVYQQSLNYRLPVASNVADVDISFKYNGVLGCAAKVRFIRGGTLYPFYPLMLPSNGINNKLKADTLNLIIPVGNSATTELPNEAFALSDFSIMTNASNDSIFAGRLTSKEYVGVNRIFLWDRPTAPKIYYEIPTRVVSIGDVISYTTEFIAANIVNAHNL